jgi:FMN phosphatase YigB (HAD superfamily)
MSNIKVIGFDLDGTLYETTPEILSRVRGKIYEKLASSFDISLEKAKDLFEKNYNGTFSWSCSGSKTIEELARKHNKTLNGADIVQKSTEQADILDLVNPNPGLNNMLKRLSNRFGLDLITSTSYSLAHGKLKKIGIASKLFDNFWAEKKYGSKTTGTIYQNWLKVREISPDQALYVGDNKKQDIKSSGSLGIQTCYIGQEPYPAANFHIKNILDLEQLF